MKSSDAPASPVGTPVGYAGVCRFVDSSLSLSLSLSPGSLMERYREIAR